MFSYLGFENIVKLLIENHAEVDIKDRYGKIPLHFAIQYGKTLRLKMQTY